MLSGVFHGLDSILDFHGNDGGTTMDSALVYEMGEEIARQCKLIGVNINFAPVIDMFQILKPIINSRSFGESIRNVSSLV